MSHCFLLISNSYLLENPSLIAQSFHQKFLIDCFRYGSCATPRDFEIYALDASFEDPLMCANGWVLVLFRLY